MDCITASSVNMFKNKVNTSQEGGLHVDEHCWILGNPMGSLSTCYLGLGWQILLNLCRTTDVYTEKWFVFITLSVCVTLQTSILTHGLS